MINNKYSRAGFSEYKNGRLWTRELITIHGKNIFPMLTTPIIRDWGEDFSPFQQGCLDETNIWLKMGFAAREE